MNVQYCDLCMSPIKEGEVCMLYSTKPGALPPPKDAQDTEAYYEYLLSVAREVKEICPCCKDIFDRIFDLKLTRLCEIVKDIEGTWKLPNKLNPKERKISKKEPGDGKKKRQS